MDPTVVAAWIAAGVSVLTLVGTLAAQYLGSRAASRDAEKAVEEQRRQLDRTFGEQRQHLDRTLAEQRDQLDRTLAEQRTRTLNERFATAAEQLGSDKPPEVRLAGVYAMAGLADDWAENRQVCVDVLCAYLRMPYEPDPDQDAPVPQRLSFRASREVRHTVIRLITAHLQEGSAKSWQGLHLDFTGAVFDGGNFGGAQFSGGVIDFTGARFTGGTVNFMLAEFSAPLVSFEGVEFSGGTINFEGTKFSRGRVSFSRAKFSGGEVTFRVAEFSGGTIYFGNAEFSGGTIYFEGVEFSGGKVDFLGTMFSGGTVSFLFAQFSGGKVEFFGTMFSGGTVDFSTVRDWSVPPEFFWTDTPPLGVKLPDAGGKANLASALRSPGGRARAVTFC